MTTTACNNSNNEITKLVKEWETKEIFFPKQMTFTISGEDTVDSFLFEGKYKIVTYSDSIGCISCKLKLRQWMIFIEKIDSLMERPIPVLFFLHPKNEKEIKHIFMEDNFDYPVCVDLNDDFGRLNMFLSEMVFQTFLLDKNNKVIAIGNLIHNPKIEELYLKIILGNNVSEKDTTPQTTVEIDETLVDMGKFDWAKEQQTCLTLINAGHAPLVVIDATTSCGCTSVEYDKEPVQPGKALNLFVKYKADQLGHFNKSINVFCNTEGSPLLLKIMGEALSD